MKAARRALFALGFAFVAGHLLAYLLVPTADHQPWFQATLLPAAVLCTLVAQFLATFEKAHRPSVQTVKAEGRGNGAQDCAIASVDISRTVVTPNPGNYRATLLDKNTVRVQPPPGEIPSYWRCVVQIVEH